MATVREVSTKRDILSILIKEELGVPLTETRCEILPYGYDPRIGWDTYIVTVEGFGVVGFTDGI